MVEKVLGPVRYDSEIAQRVSTPGVATGMAYTRVGGEILFIEASIHRGAGRLMLTGQVGMSILSVLVCCTFLLH